MRNILIFGMKTSVCHDRPKTLWQNRPRRVGVLAHNRGPLCHTQTQVLSRKYLYFAPAFSNASVPNIAFPEISRLFGLNLSSVSSGVW